MRKNNALTCVLATLICVLVSPMSGLLAQQEGSHTSPRKEATRKIVGCLAQGSEPGSLVLSDEDGNEAEVIGLADLKKHVGHKVRLTGEWARQEGHKVFKTRKIEHLSTHCGS